MHADDLLQPAELPASPTQLPGTSSMQRTTGSRVLATGSGQRADSSKAGILEYTDEVFSCFLAADLPEAVWLTPSPDGPLGETLSSCRAHVGLTLADLGCCHCPARTSDVTACRPLGIRGLMNILGAAVQGWTCMSS